MIIFKKLIIKILQIINAIDIKELLWTNSNPENDFVSQTISSLEKPPSDFDEIQILWAANTTSDAYGVARGLVTSSGAIEFISSLELAKTGYVICRLFTINSDSVWFNGCYLKSDLADTSASLANNNIIPLKIYGIKYGI